MHRQTCYIISMPSGGVVTNQSRNQSVTSALGVSYLTTNRGALAPLSLSSSRVVREPRVIDIEKEEGRTDRGRAATRAVLAEALVAAQQSPHPTLVFGQKSISSKLISSQIGQSAGRQQFAPALAWGRDGASREGILSTASCSTTL
jgi:hypothetical protein